MSRGAGLGPVQRWREAWLRRRMPRPGREAPDFTLPLAGTGDEFLRLRDLRGRPLVLLFFPFAFSPGCCNEIEDFTARYPDFASRGAQVVGISTDSPYALRAWADRYQVPFPLASDYNRRVIRRYGVAISRWGLGDFADRAVFVLDERGVVRWVWRAPDLGYLPDPDQVLAHLPDPPGDRPGPAGHRPGRR
ncbi:Peroxiredoxin [Thermaerobacter subterraneus DSM 13965]|uniref:Peroxiredoxin n=1 Tax=Thermaerobacter subterraneus DSM 13965 TaxID=867903 RepID=K6P374_9FIRM|nr:Peroxiredoxin [Thermaerobacter subterraneus DSM 13965]